MRASTAGAMGSGIFVRAIVTTPSVDTSRVALALSNLSGVAEPLPSTCSMKVHTLKLHYGPKHARVSTFKHRDALEAT